jgi:hypothetical protein
MFCEHCSVRLYTYGHVAEISGDYGSVMRVQAVGGPL